MGTELAVYTETDKPLNALEDAERKIMNAEKAAYESGFSIAVELEAIKNKQLFKLAGFKTWEAYCAAGRTPYPKRHANKLIAALRYRRSLPDPGPAGPGFGWTERSVRPLTELSTPTVAKLCAKAAIKTYSGLPDEEKKSTTFTKVLTQQIKITKNTVKERIEQHKKRSKALHDARLAANLRRIESYVRKTAIALDQYTGEDWAAAEEEAPGITLRVADVLEQLAGFLRDE